ncbi:hypothetical protein AHiyo6_04400 [Arthrobacter sp. Hiyo6]|nr:hypothetical protein AHiyo6_04400 [Arthrobacter sp. Hiyo6]
MKLTVRIGWVCLATVSLGILVFGLVVAVVPMDGDAALYRAGGLASTGLGLFGALIVLVPYRRIERWAWCALWFYLFSGWSTCSETSRRARITSTRSSSSPSR